VKALVIGGEKHGEFIDVLDGAQVWVDLEHAVTHRLRRITNTITDMQGHVKEVYTMDLAVHQAALGPQELDITMAALSTLAMNEFTRAHGTKVDVPEEPAGSSLIMPGQDGGVGPVPS
jgi:hypothetical protein